jgi:hypothetical protein
LKFPKFSLGAVAYQRYLANLASCGSNDTWQLWGGGKGNDVSSSNDWSAASGGTGCCKL